MSKSFDQLRGALKLMQEGNPQAALVRIHLDLDEMSAGNPQFNPMVEAAAQIRMGEVFKAKLILEQADEKLNRG